MSDHTTPHKPAATEIRFWKKVNKLGPDDCWNWTGAKVRDYGKFRYLDKFYLSHRVAWELTNGPIPDGLNILHRCDNPSCCNPSHLFLGTQLDNIQDMFQKNRQPDHSGEQHGRAKVNAVQVAEIRKLSKEGMTQNALSAKFGISQGTISEIIRRKIWKHVL